MLIVDDTRQEIKERRHSLTSGFSETQTAELQSFNQMNTGDFCQQHHSTGNEKVTG